MPRRLRITVAPEYVEMERRLPPYALQQRLAALKTASAKRAARTIHLWGRGLSNVGLPSVITVRGDVSTSLERRTGLVICGGPKNEGTALTRGVPTARHYVCTLGRPVRGGGWCPVAEVWWAEPIVRTEDR